MKIDLTKQADIFRIEDDGSTVRTIARNNGESEEDYLNRAVKEFEKYVELAKKFKTKLFKITIKSQYI